MTKPPLPAQRRKRAITPSARGKFLDAVGSGWSVTAAAERAGFSRQRFYELRDEDESFAVEWTQADERGTQVLEDELRKRAVEGWDEDTFDGDGMLQRRVRRYSPALLIFLLKAKRPDVYRDNATVQVTGADGGPVQMIADYRPTTLGDLLRLARELDVDTIDGEATEETPHELEPPA